MPPKQIKNQKVASSRDSQPSKLPKGKHQSPKAPGLSQQKPATKGKTPSTTTKAAKPSKGGKPQKSTKDDKEKQARTVSKEDKAASKIQSLVRGFLARRLLKKKREDRRKYEELMEQLEKEAWLEIVRREREEADKERQKEEAERKRKAAGRKRQQRILEAAFDGNLPVIEQVLAEGVNSDKENYPNHGGKSLDFLIQKRQRMLINCEDPNGNTPLSEAAAGGDVETITYLVQRGALVNCRGAFKRTPLYRAAFGGHLEAVEILLENGADPRLYDSDGNTPDQIAAIPAIGDVIRSWDIAETDRIIQLAEKQREEWESEHSTFTKAETERTETEISDVEEEYRTNQKQLRKAYEKLNKRIFEHDKCALVGGSKAEITLKMVHDAECDLARCQTLERQAREKLAMLRLKLREQRGVESSGTDLVAKMGVTCNIRELDDVLMRDIGDKIKKDGRWPLLVDSSPQSATFLRYRDTNYIKALNPSDMEPDVLRKALLGAIRYGKPLVVDMMEVDMTEALEDRLNEVSQDLYKNVISKKILENERYLDLVKPTDGPEYNRTSFMDDRISKFKFVLVTNIHTPPKEWLSTFYPIRVIVSSR